ncbi:hypothetical protein BJP34_24100 [Moorena producens PAL-8-15-08-1]|uniref:Uncharacterized protein n=1 Tax=Moorena producens PAL-8-15-08-1 TaxID=1458985 RepID=A0A1D8TWT2_9CYAN|nr:hypothetical protein [Moorena producens]AOX02110.1 hypothetical protein BJP34_24100 [Moorena producens PAL-8-15-08-1]
MSIDIENMENNMNSLVYEQPTLKNYGTMKSLTLGAGGSGADGARESLVGTDAASDDFNSANPVDSFAPGVADVVHDGNGGLAPFDPD